MKTTYFVTFLASISPIFNNPYTEFVSLGTNYNVESEYINSMSTSEFNSQNYDVCLKKSVKTDVKITYCLVIVIVDKISIIGNSCVSPLALDLSHHNKYEYANVILTSLFFYQNYDFC